MEAMPRLPMISFELKTSHDLTDFQQKIKEYIKYHYNEDENTFNNQIHQMEGLRASAIRPAKDATGCATMKRYFCQLHFLTTRFPMGKDGDASFKIKWKDHYTESYVSCSDITIEFASILYNIGALHCQLGAADNRTTADGMKMACSHFQCAAWAFQQIMEEYPQASSYDTATDLLPFMNLICLAQAQECILEKSMMDNRKASIVMKIAVQCAEFYKHCLKLLTDPPDESLMGSMGKTRKKWTKYVKFKISFYTCISLLYQGQQAEEQQKMGERVAYYQAAFEKLEESKKLAKDLDHYEAIQETLQFTQDIVEGKKKAATNENEFIYHEQVPGANLLPEIKGASLVKGIGFNINDVEVSGPDIFGRLVPLSAHQTSSIYSEELAKLQRKMTSTVLKREEELDTFLSTLQLDELQARDQWNVPQDLIDRCAAFSAKPDAIQCLLDAMSSLTETFQDVESMLKEIRQLLQKEEEAVVDYEQIVGKRPPSIAATDLTREAHKYQDAHTKASESNQTLQKAMELHVANLNLLSLPLVDLKAQIPVISLESPEDEASMKEMQNLMNKVQEMKTQRGMLLGQLREAISRDDITPLVVKFTGDNKEELFKQEIQKHQKQVALIKQNLSAQDKILGAIQESYGKYNSARRNIGDKLHRREVMVASLKASYDAYEDLLAKSNKGLEFYSKLQSNVSKLLQRVRSTCKVQEEEREQILATILKDVPRNSTSTALPSAQASPRATQNNYAVPEKYHVQEYAEPAATTGGLKLKDYLNIKKETGKLSLVSSTTPGPLYNTAATPASYAPAMSPHIYDHTSAPWVPGIRPAPLGSEETEPPTSKHVDSDVTLRRYPQWKGGNTNETMDIYPQPYAYGYPSYMEPQGVNTPYNAYNAYGGYSSLSTSNYPPGKGMPANLEHMPYPMSAPNYGTPYSDPQCPPLTANPATSISNRQFHASEGYASLPLPTTPQPSIMSQPSMAPQPSMVPQPSVMPQPSIAPKPSVMPQPSIVPQSSILPHPPTSTPYYPSSTTTVLPVNPNVASTYPSSYSMAGVPFYGPDDGSQRYATTIPEQKPTAVNYPPQATNNPLLPSSNVTQPYQTYVPSTSLSNNVSLYAASTINSTVAPSAAAASATVTPLTPATDSVSNVVPAVSNITPAIDPSSSKKAGFIVSHAAIDYRSVFQDYAQAPLPTPTVGTTQGNNSNIPTAASFSSQPGYAAAGVYPSSNISYPDSTVGVAANAIPNAGSINFNQNDVDIKKSDGYIHNNLSTAGSSTVQTQFNVTPVAGATMPYTQYGSSNTYQDYATTIPGTYFPTVNQNVIPQQSIPVSFSQSNPQEYGINGNLNSVAYQQAGYLNQATTTTTTSNAFAVTSPKEKSSNLDLLVGLDFEVAHAPLQPQTKIQNVQKPPKVPENCETELTSKKEVQPESPRIQQTKKEPDDKRMDMETMQNLVPEVEKFEKFVEGLTLKTLNGPTTLDVKWKEITDLQEKDNNLKSISVARCYPVKNRFPDILPYDDSRVELPSTKDDYINASYLKPIIPGALPLILTQAPLPVTYVDFWTMVMEQQVEVVVCLLADSELGGHIYWPLEKSQELQFGTLRLSLQSCNVRSHWVERILSLTAADTKIARVVVHLQFTAWPGSSFPASPAPFLAFAQEVNSFFQQQRSCNHSAVVHCLSGVGRTGLFCLILAAMLEVRSGRGIPDLVHLSSRISRSRKNCLRDREHLKFAYQTLLYFLQDMLMKSGILTTRCSFDDKTQKTGKCHTRHPSEDFLVSSDSEQLQSKLQSATLDDPPVNENNDLDQIPMDQNPLLAAMDPNAFSLSLNDLKPRGKQKFTPDEFTKSSSTLSVASTASSDDPLSSLDPLWSLKK